MVMVKEVQVGNVTIGGGTMPVVVAGPCVIESDEHAGRMAEIISEITERIGFQFVFKASYDKANRTSIHSFRGPGLEKGLEILSRIREDLGIPVLTDIHDKSQIERAAHAVDMIQIPAFLCRQTELFIEEGNHDIPVNVKKGQFLAPEDVRNIIEKSEEAGIRHLTLTERGTSFGYNRLVVDFTSLPIMRSMGVPVIFDATHSVQRPGGGGKTTSGNREFVPCLCRGAVAVGCDALFLEVHDQPDLAKSDGPNMISPGTLEKILMDVKSIYQAIGGFEDGEF